MMNTSLTASTVATKVIGTVTWVQLGTVEVIAVDKEEHNSVVQELNETLDEIEALKSKHKQLTKDHAYARKLLKEHNIPFNTDDDIRRENKRLKAELEKLRKGAVENGNKQQYVEGVRESTPREDKLKNTTGQDHVPTKSKQAREQPKTSSVGSDEKQQSRHE
jgi:FtsZ-binding cell division protein ZapB